MELPEGFPLEPVDAHYRPLAPGFIIEILEVSSCARGLPKEDQDRLVGLVGQKRKIVEIDGFGFVWLSFSPTEFSSDFSLLPTEVAAA